MIQVCLSNNNNNYNDNPFRPQINKLARWRCMGLQSSTFQRPQVLIVLQLVYRRPPALRKNRENLLLREGGTSVHRLITLKFRNVFGFICNCLNCNYHCDNHISSLKRKIIVQQSSMYVKSFMSVIEIPTTSAFPDKYGFTIFFQIYLAKGTFNTKTIDLCQRWYPVPCLSEREKQRIW